MPSQVQNQHSLKSLYRYYETHTEIYTPKSRTEENAIGLMYIYME